MIASINLLNIDSLILTFQCKINNQTQRWNSITKTIYNHIMCITYSFAGESASICDIQQNCKCQ